MKATAPFCLLFFISLCCTSYAQITTRSHKINRELAISYDNDMYFGTDQYYTSGANITHSRLVKSRSYFYKHFKSKKSDSLKVIVRFNYGHKIFTPHEINERDISELDRPYAGWHYLNMSVLNFPSVNGMNTFDVQLGMVGEASGIGNFHKWWHSNLGIERPKGWQYQIKNEPILNLTYARTRSWKFIKKLNFVTDSKIKIGNGLNKISQDVTLRYGKFNRLFNSGFAHSRLSNLIPKVGNNDSEEEEGILFYGLKADYVLSNIFLQGSIFNDNSPHIEKLERIVLTQHWGFMYTNYYTTFCIIFYRISPEVKGSRIHRYVSLNLIFRF